MHVVTRFLLLPFLLLPASVFPQPAITPQPFDASIDTRIARVTGNLPAGPLGFTWRHSTLADRMAHYRVPGVSIAVIDNYQIVWARGFGVIGAGSTQAVNPQTLFQAASISKSVSALGALLLADQGKLSLDDDVNVRLHSWKLPDNQYTAGHPVTLRELLSHTAGTTVGGFPGYSRGAQLPTLLQTLDGVPPANTVPVRVDRQPGAGWRYSGGGYMIVQQMIEDASGQAFPDYMHQSVLAPLQMSWSTFAQPLPRQLWTNAASGTLASGERLPGDWHVYPEMAAAGLWTTPSDLAKFAIDLMDAQAGRSGTKLSSGAEAQMLTSQAYVWLYQSYDGQGIFLTGENDSLRFFHEGSNAGFTSFLIGYRSGKGAIIMTNSDNGILLFDEIARSIAHEYDWPDAAPIIPAGFRGLPIRLFLMF
jgi:CubicO group peptidase (beta-lactamase class C family)